MDSDGVFSLIEQHAVTPDAEPQQSLKLPTESFGIAFARLRVTVKAMKDVERHAAFNRADFGGNIWTKAESLHPITDRPWRSVLHPL